jgi:hypothetical protein
MTTNLGTLLIALYVLIDDHVIPSGKRAPGRPKELSDAELVCLAGRKCYRVRGSTHPAGPWTDPFRSRRQFRPASPHTRNSQGCDTATQGDEATCMVGHQSR